jgi:hypothetical protein
MKRDQHNLKFTLTNFEGEEVTYNLLPLKRKNAAYVSHRFLQTLLKGFAKAAKGGQEALLEALSAIEFDVLWDLASILLKGAEIHGAGGIARIDNLDESEYFEDRPEELYLAVFNGVKENYPGVFSRVRGLLGDLAAKTSDLATAPESTPDTSDTA